MVTPAAAASCSFHCVSYVCNGGALTCDLETKSFSRSLVQTLIAATSTAAFIAAANFGFAPNISSKAGTWARWFQCLKMALGEPFRAFGHSLISAAVTWLTLRSKIIIEPNEECATGDLSAPTAICGRLIQKIQKIRECIRKKVTRRGLVAIMLNCPILIQIPPDFVVTEEPELAASPKISNRRPAADSTIYSRQKPSKSKVRISKPEWMKDMKIVRDIHAWNALDLPPAGAAHEKGVISSPQAADHVEGVIIRPQLAAADHVVISPHDDHHDGVISPQHQRPHEPLYIKLHPSLWSFKGIDERTLLLRLKLVPQYEQLRYLRARSTFEAVVTTVQSFGYMLAVLQRIVMHLPISPLEANMAFFNLLIVLQFIMNLYSCVHYQRPLLLRLSFKQFNQYSEAHDKPSTNVVSTTPSSNDPAGAGASSRTTKVTRALVLVIGSLISVAVYGIIQLAFIKYALSYLPPHHRHHRCILCSLSSFLICLLGLSALILIGLFSFPLFRKFWKRLDKKVKVHYAFRICTSIISTSSTILALVATIISWEDFNKPNRNLLLWIVAFVES